MLDRVKQVRLLLIDHGLRAQELARTFEARMSVVCIFTVLAAAPNAMLAFCRAYHAKHGRISQCSRATRPVRLA